MYSVSWPHPTSFDFEPLSEFDKIVLLAYLHNPKFRNLTFIRGQENGSPRSIHKINGVAYIILKEYNDQTALYYSLKEGDYKFVNYVEVNHPLIPFLQSPLFSQIHKTLCCFHKEFPLFIEDPPLTFSDIILGTPNTFGQCSRVEAFLSFLKNYNTLFGFGTPDKLPFHGGLIPENLGFSKDGELILVNLYQSIRPDQLVFQTSWNPPEFFSQDLTNPTSFNQQFGYAGDLWRLGLLCACFAFPKFTPIFSGNHVPPLYFLCNRAETEYFHINNQFQDIDLRTLTDQEEIYKSLKFLWRYCENDEQRLLIGYAWNLLHIKPEDRKLEPLDWQKDILKNP